ncbi:hypothetical protein SYK_30950 [Pseudodesulfovibrio nedwellii]|uniref:Uncharacterized protein n=1 Tax=Pseudodesulfovibrio nedwellii TaxID=2973072 RepID=A0ABM8B526_9BACT|nr:MULTISPECIES: hypothetical protein [Pseudodesulfovibrio]BDQ38735.1 hypothetical protein SYK_30950 [Pseudodesulfovibrio nedwellii]
MKRREFFSRFIPRKGHTEEVEDVVRQQKEPEKAPLTENECFLRAMALGIDPATVTPRQLEKLVSESERQKDCKRA